MIASTWRAGSLSQSPEAAHPDRKHYVDWASRTGEFAAYSDWDTVKSVLDQRRGADDEREAWLRKMKMYGEI